MNANDLAIFIWCILTVGISGSMFYYAASGALKEMEAYKKEHSEYLKEYREYLDKLYPKDDLK